MAETDEDREVREIATIIVRKLFLEPRAPCEDVFISPGRKILIHGAIEDALREAFAEADE